MNKRILLINKYAGFIGGIEEYVYNLAQLLRQKGWEVIGGFKERTNNTQTPRYLSIFNQCLFNDEIFRFLDSNEDLLILINKVDDPHWVETLSKHSNTAMVVHDHDLYCFRKHKYFPLVKKNCHYKLGIKCTLCSLLLEKSPSPPGIKLLSPINKFKLLTNSKNISTFIVLSEFMRNQLLNNGYEKKKIIKLPPVNKHYLQRLSPFDTKASVLKLLFIGQVIYGKGIDLLIKIITRLKVPYQLTIIGDGDYLKTLRKLIQKNHLEKDVVLKGRLDKEKVFEHIDHSHLIMQTSRWQEPFGMTGIESFSRARPVIGFDVGGISEWLKDKHNGFLLPEGDIHGFSSVINKYSKDLSKLKALGECAHDFYMSHFSIDIFYKQFLHAFNSKQ